MAEPMNGKRKIDPKKYYTVAKTLSFLRRANVKAPETVKKYCRAGDLQGKQIGPKRVWHVLGSSIIAWRKKYGLDD